MKKLSGLLLFVVLLSVSNNAVAGNAYWQQHVGYSINVTLTDSNHTLDGISSVNYTNNSPDTLHSIFFHLYYNAFQPGSMMDERSRAIISRPVVDRIAKLPPDEWGFYNIGNVTVQGKPMKALVTGTIMRIDLAQPLLPGESTTISVPFHEQIPRVIRRGGWMTSDGVEYSMSQWYPKVCEYDNEGWQIQEYIAREFYGVWGEFQVALTLPSRFTVGATGECTNPLEVKHGYDQIASGVKEGLIAPDPGVAGTTTWHFHANPVHDFAWVADDEYVHEWKTWRDTITLHSFYKQQYSKLWEKSLEYTEFSLNTYSNLVGPYVYRDFSTTMAGDGGMEYPQLIMITGYRPGLSLPGVIAHEVAHQWFYGMLGSNESRQAFMDEGFTSFMTTESMGREFGRFQQLPGTERSALDWFLPQFDNRSDNFRWYQGLAVTGYDEPLSIPHDWFREDAVGGLVYGKTQAILSMLEYDLGDSVFWLGMRNYYATWRLKHPHLVDFQTVMERTSGQKLDWFFDEWFYTNRTLDYDAESVHSESQGDSTLTTFKLKNRDLAVMPLDLTLHYNDGSTGQATIPLALNQKNGYQKPGDDRIFLPDWDWVSPEYKVTIATKLPVSWFEIDTSMRLQDLNRYNNFGGHFFEWHPVRGYWALWKQYFAQPPMDGYYAVVRPIVTYDANSSVNLGIGIKHGFNLLGSGDFKIIAKTKPTRIERDGTVTRPKWYDDIDAESSSSIDLRFIDRLTKATTLFSKMDGIATLQFGFTRQLRPVYLTLGPEQTISGYVQMQDRLNYAYPYYHTDWSAGKTRVAGANYGFRSESGATKFDAFVENSFWNSDYNFGRVRARVTQSFDLGNRFGLQLRLVGGTATGNVPIERRWNLGMASPVDEQTNGFWRAATNVDSSLDRKIGAFIEGGAGARGYSMAIATPQMLAATVGQHMLGFSGDVAIPNPLSSLGSFAATFRFNAFADAGWISDGNPSFFNDIQKRLMTDAGVTVYVDWLNWPPYQLRGVAEEYSKIPALGFTFPIYLNHPLDGKDPIAFRWKLSLGTTF